MTNSLDYLQSLAHGYESHICNELLKEHRDMDAINRSVEDLRKVRAQIDEQISALMECDTPN
ncbi:hypothetical protein [Corynebacterium macclintockiae]|uniref:hypothetical protein n=1 Tax=Corynebacterium macclintockiae TaxID=2913501 RepID=UPI003EC0BB5E